MKFILLVPQPASWLTLAGTSVLTLPVKPGFASSVKFALFSHKLQGVELILFRVYALMTLGHRCSLSVQKKFRSSDAFSLSGHHKVPQFWHLKMDNAEKMGHSARYHNSIK